MNKEIEIAGDAAISATGLRHKFRITDSTAPLVFLVHGRAGSHDVMWAFRRCIPDHYSVIAPQAPTIDPLGGFSWWEVAEGSRGEFTSALAAGGLLNAFMKRAIAHYGLTPPILIGFGFSQGSGLLSTIIQSKENHFDGVAFLAGFVMRDKNAIKTRDTKIYMAHGSRDETLPVDLAKKGAEHLASLGFQVQFEEDPVGHKIGPNGVRKLREWVTLIK